jgi:hypothetical protein
MIRRNILISCFVMVTVAALQPAFGIAGIGVHYGIDLSMAMDPVHGEKAGLGDLQLDVSNFGVLPAGYTKTVLTGNDLPISIDRTDWQRHPFNLGGKIYIDMLPVIDGIEISANYAMWQYKGSIIYPTSITFNTANALPTADIKDIAQINYDTTLVTLKDLGLNNPFLKNTPYAKLHFDLTVRKFLLKFPPVVKSIKIYGGGGASVFFATPVLSASFIEKTLGNTLSTVRDVSALQSALFGQQSDAMKKLGKQFMMDLMTPHAGMHLDVGAQLKFPVFPVGFYLDGKYLIPFSKLDPALKSSSGLLFNAGILFAM